MPEPVPLNRLNERTPFRHPHRPGTWYVTDRAERNIIIVCRDIPDQPTTSLPHNTMVDTIPTTR